MSSLLLSPVAQSNMGSDWNWLLVFIIFVVVLTIALLIQARFSEVDAAEYEHHEEDDHHDVVEMAPAAIAASPPKPEPEPEPKPEPEEKPEAEPKEADPVKTTAKPDDLKKIEGIGPKVAGILNENGITTFAQLAETSVEKLDEILDANKLQMMNPKSWPQQAKLAAAGDWENLTKLQDDLKGGL